jgi:hypothetical protein
MGFFTSLFGKKEITSAEYADLLNKYTKLSSEVAVMKVECEKLETRFHSLLSAVNRTKSKYGGEDDLQQDILRLKQFFGTPSESYAATQGLLNKDTE